jgi:hypothetical protein
MMMASDRRPPRVGWVPTQLLDDKRANFKTFQFGRGQGGRKFQPEEYMEYLRILRIEI